MENNEKIGLNELNLEKFNEIINNSYGELLDEDIEKSILESETIIKKSIDDLMNQFNNFKVDIKFINKSDNVDPTYAYPGDSGFDLRANLPNDTITLLPGEWKVIPTGLYFELPNNYDLTIRPRSGLAVKNGITVLNSPGTVDSNYRGEVNVILINHSKVEFLINHGDRIAQGVISPVANTSNGITLTKTNSLSTTERGENKFGSSGIK